MSTITDVAHLAGVSKSTASRALSGRGYVSNETRTRVEKAARALSFVAHSSASSLATGRTHTIGLIMPSVDRWYFSELLAGVQLALLTSGLDLALYSGVVGSSERTTTLDYALARRRFDGIIAVGLQPSAHEAERMLRTNRPLVTVGPHTEGSSSVTLDDRLAARVATEHLIELGHRDIAFLGGAADPDARGFGDALRIAGYLETMSEAGLADHVRLLASDPTIPDSYATAAHLLGNRRHRPTAIVGVCDESAIGAIVAARRLGIAVPTELSVIGIDDHQYADMYTLTTMRQRPREQGAEAVRLLRERIQSPDAPLERVVEPSTLIIRNSTATPR